MKHHVETHNEFIRQCMNAVERARSMMQVTAERVTTPDDPYAGLMWHDDADTLGEALAVLRSLQYQGSEGEVLASIGNARRAAARLSYDDEKQGMAKHLLLELSSALAARMTYVRESEYWGVHVVEDGLRRTRPMTRKETWLYRLFNVKPERV